MRVPSIHQFAHKAIAARDLFQPATSFAYRFEPKRVFAVRELLLHPVRGLALDANKPHPTRVSKFPVPSTA